MDLNNLFTSILDKPTIDKLCKEGISMKFQFTVGFCKDEKEKEAQQPTTPGTPVVEDLSNLQTKNGTYLLLKDGTRTQSIEHTISVDEVIGIEICEIGKPKVILFPRSAGKLQIVNNDDSCKLFGKAEPRESFALEDFDGKGNTEALLNGGSPAAKAVKEMGQNLYIPSLGELNMIYRHKDEINGILIHIEGADTLEESNTWSSTAYNSINAWYVTFSNGYSNGTYGKYNSTVVRPVVAL